MHFGDVSRIDRFLLLFDCIALFNHSSMEIQCSYEKYIVMVLFIFSLASVGNYLQNNWLVLGIGNQPCLLQCLGYGP